MIQNPFDHRGCLTAFQIDEDDEGFLQILSRQAVLHSTRSHLGQHRHRDLRSITITTFFVLHCDILFNSDTMRTIVLSGILILLLVSLSPAVTADITQTPTVNTTMIAANTTTTSLDTTVPVNTTIPITSTPVPAVPDGSHFSIQITNLDVLAQAVTLFNNGTQPVPLDNWFFVNSGITQTYTFQSFILQPNATVTIFAGSGTSSATALYWGQDGTVWNPSGDTATLFDNLGTVISVCIATPAGVTTPVPTPTTVVTTLPAPAHGTPRYHAGDVLWTDYTRQDKYWVVLAYDTATDKYGRSVILPNRDGTWGHLVTDDILWDDRLYVETYYPVLIMHVDPLRIVIGDFTIATPAISGPTVQPTPDPRNRGFTIYDIFRTPADAEYKRTHQTGPKLNFIRWYPPWART